MRGLRLRSALRRSWVATVLIALATPSSAFAQSQPNEADEWRTKMWVGDVAFASANAIIAGVSAGIVQELRGGSFRDGFANGALGGAIAYGGRRVAVEGFWGAGLVGRQVSAVGMSITRNSANNKPMLRQIWLPLGPVTVELNHGAEFTVSARADLFASGWLLAAVLDDRLNFDAESSISSGAPVFRAPDHHLRSGDRMLGGTAIGGVVIVARHSENLRANDILAHERVHVLQYDFAQLLWGDPLEELVGQHVPYVNLAQRHVRIGVLLPAFAQGLGRVSGMGGRDAPWELEAYYLVDR